MKKLCKKCNGKMNSVILETQDGFHEHLNCKKDERHPTYCCTDRKWIGK